MRIPRIYVPVNLSEEKSSELILDTEASNHILQVLRLKIGAPLILFNGQGGEFSAEIVSVQNKKVIVKIIQFQEGIRESPLAIHLLQGISRGEKMDFTIQKAVELGVTTITPLFTEYCNVKLDDARLTNRLLHWQKVAVNAAEQSGRCFVPKIFSACKINDSVSSLSFSGMRLLLDHRAEITLKDLKIEKNENKMILLVGPEGGFSDSEIVFAENHNFKKIKFGPRILRTETAGLAAISVLQSLLGDV